MNLQFDWLAGDGDGRWESIARVKGYTRVKIPHWVWGTLLAVVVTLGVSGYVCLSRWYEEALDQVAFQIQSAIDLEARALARRDLELFLAQQDRAAPEWVTWQATRVRTDLLRANAAASDGCTDTLPQGSQKRAPLDLSAEVQSVEMRGDIAWVEVIAGQVPVRQARFYRQTDLGWVHTAPRVEFWKKPVALDYDRVRVRGHERDLPHIEPLVRHITSVLDDLCATLHCPPDSVLEVNLAIEKRIDELPAFSGHALTLASPWLSGVPVDETWDQEYLDKVTYWVAYAVASRFLHHAADSDLDLLQKAIVAEYAALYSGKDATSAPLLRRIVERHGTGALPEVLYALRERRSLSWFLAQWLSLSPSDREVDYFETLLNVEREAILIGQKDTFTLLQDDDHRWLEMRETSYDRIQSGELGFCPSAIQVQSVEIVRDITLVTLKERVSIEQGGPEPKSINRIVFFRLQDGDWKRSWHTPSNLQTSWVVPSFTHVSVPAYGESQ